MMKCESDSECTLLRTWSGSFSSVDFGTFGLLSLSPLGTAYLWMYTLDSSQPTKVHVESVQQTWFVPAAK